MFGKWQLAEVTRKYHTTCHQKVIVSYSMICQAANLKLENIELCTKDFTNRNFNKPNKSEKVSSVSNINYKKVVCYVAVVRFVTQALRDDP